MTLNQRVGRRIRVRRVELGMTQTELAQHLSVGQSNLSYIELGQRDISVRLLGEIARALCCPPAYFLRDEPVPAGEDETTAPPAAG